MHTQRLLSFHYFVFHLDTCAEFKLQKLFEPNEKYFNQMKQTRSKKTTVRLKKEY